MVYKVLIIGHLLGDFYFQTNRLAENKTKKVKGLALHGILYFAALLLVLLLFVNKGISLEMIVGLTGISIFHCVVDCVKIRLERKAENTEKYGHIIFLTDQFVHLLFLYLFINICEITVGKDALLSASPQSSLYTYISWTAAGLLCWKPASIFVAIIFKSIPNIINQSESDAMKQEGSCRQEECPYKKIEAESVKVGSWIGILEREIILILGILDQFGAIGFVLAAKSMARFKQLENKAFAEKYLVGTLLSTLISFLCIIFVRC